jgi:hypothetical protein
MSPFFIKRVAECQTNASHGLLHDKIEITKKLKKAKGKQTRLLHGTVVQPINRQGNSVIPLKLAATHTSASSLIFGRNQAGRKLGLLEA